MNKLGKIILDYLNELQYEGSYSNGGSESGGSEKEGNVTPKAEVLERDLKLLVLLALKIEKGAMSRRRSQSQEAGKSKAMDSPEEPSEGRQPHQNLNCSPVKCMTSRSVRESFCVV